MREQITEIIVEDLREIKKDIKELNQRIAKHETRITLISAIVAMITANFQKYFHRFF